MSFNAYDATKAYSIGDYVTSSSVNYKSLVDANVGNTPVSSPSQWATCSSADAIGSNGFVGTDVGRMVRLYSEPALWASGTTYSVGNVVVYGGAGLRYEGATYWKALVGSNTGNVPGVDLTKWALFSTGAIWSWGRITALSNIIDRALAGSASIGDMTSGGGLAAAFDGILSQVAASSAEKIFTGTDGPGTIIKSSYVGKNYTAASDQAIAQAIIYPSSDKGLAFGSYTGGEGGTIQFVPTIVLNLRGKASAPASAADGTLLGTSGSISNTTAPVTIISSDLTTAWKYVWIEQITTTSLAFLSAYTLTNAIGELSLFSPPGSGVSQGITVQIVGDPLLYTTAIRTWRLGLYSDTTGWPTVGTYHEGRVWLGGVVDNRIDSSKSNGLVGSTIDCAPTAPSGAVGDANGISYVFNAPDNNPLFWMVPDHLGIVCGTQAGEWLVQASANNNPLTPTNIQAHRVTTNGCANIEPRRTGLTLAVVHRFQRKVLEYFSDVFSGKFTAHNLSEMAKHLTQSPIAEIAYQNELAPILWGRKNDGTLIGATYRRQNLLSSQPPDFIGWHRRTMGSNRVVQSICVGPSVDGTLDSLAVVTNDASSNIRHVEVAANIFEEGSALTTAWFFDDAISATSYIVGSTGITVQGLFYHAGKTIQVRAGGLDQGSFLVAADGTVALPFVTNGLFTAAYVNSFAGVMPIIAGFQYNSDGQLTRAMSPPESGARTGPALGKKRLVNIIAVLLQDVTLISFGTVFTKLRRAYFKTPGGTDYTALQAFSGVYRETLEDDYSYDGMICWRVTGGGPVTIAAIEGFVQTQDN